MVNLVIANIWAVALKPLEQKKQPHQFSYALWSQCWTVYRIRIRFYILFYIPFK